MTYTEPEERSVGNNQYIFLKEKLEELKAKLGQVSERDASSVKSLGRSHGEIQSYFQAQILDFPISSRSSEIEEKILSYYVELNKQLKLLGVDFTMLQVARNPTTWQQRQQQAIARLSMLIGYCEALLSLGCL
ncbi:Heterocyst frequency control protein PatD [Tumidithrix helvetica PCC 7403]|uniref:heterocyst frequency control protein PatD n=1 Tax=Tumidithrix helvetica TaxID=3457545 RepID=UPI003C86C893